MTKYEPIPNIYNGETYSTILYNKEKTIHDLIGCMVFLLLVIVILYIILYNCQN
jgi:hypothetical protein